MTYEALLSLQNIPDIEALSDAEIEAILAPVLTRTKLPEDYNPIAEKLGVEKDENEAVVVKKPRAKKQTIAELLAAIDGMKD